MARERPDPRQLPAPRWWLSRRGQRDGRGAAAAWPYRTRPHADGRRGGPARNADQHRQEQLQPASGLRLAPRREQQDGAPRRLRAVPPDRRGPGHPRPARDQRVPLHQHDNAAAASGTASPAARRSPDLAGLRQPGDRSQPREPRHLSVQPHARARVARLHGAARELHRLDDAQAAGRSGLQHAAGQHRPVRPGEPGGLCAAALPAVRLLHGHRLERRRAASTIRPSWSCCVVGATVSPSTPPTRWPTPTATPRTPATARSARCSSIPTTSKRIAVPIPTSSNTASWRMRRGTFPVGRGRAHGASMAKWADALFGGWTVSSIVQARSGQNLTPFFSGFYTTSPWNTGKPLDGLGNFFCCAWRPDQIGDPNSGGSREAFFDQAAYAIPAPGQLGNAKKGSLKGPGTWVVNFGFYKDVVSAGRFPAAVLGSARQRVQPPAVLPDVWERVRRSHVVLGRRGSQPTGQPVCWGQAL